MYNDIIKNKKHEFESAIDFFKSELKNLRTGRATPSLVEELKVDYYGTKTPLKQIASISAPDFKTILISPWNKDYLVDIEKAIGDSGLNINPDNDGSVIRLVLPPLTQERREELVKILNKKTEQARIKIKKVREEIWNKIKEMEKDGEISEDDKFRGKDAVQKIVDEYNKKIEEISEKKEQEIMQV